MRCRNRKDVEIKIQCCKPRRHCRTLWRRYFPHVRNVSGPVDQSKPWDTKGIEGVHRFLRKFWRLYVDEIKGLIITDDEPTPAELKVLHKTIKKIEEDTERFSFNTAVSAFMIAVNELGDMKCHKREILEPLLILITPYAPHIAEELYQMLHSSCSPW